METDRRGLGSEESVINKTDVIFVLTKFTAFWEDRHGSRNSWCGKGYEGKRRLVWEGVSPHPSSTNALTKSASWFY